MRWEAQEVTRQPTLAGMPELLRTVRRPEFHGITFHEVRARQVLNKVPARSGLPFRWTVNPYRGCSHACTYCFARRTHEYLDLDSGADFDSQVVVKVNAAEVLAGQLRAGLRSGRWQREHVAMGTNTDPYQRAEGRYRLMPGIIDALTEARTPFSILTKGTLLARDIDRLVHASRHVEVGLAVSIAMPDQTLQRTIEPGTPTPAARLDLVRKLREAGLPCAVFLAPVLPLLTDGDEELEAMITAAAQAGATGLTVLALHLRPGAREWFHRWLRTHRPDLVESYRRLYRRGSYVDPAYRRELAARVRPLLARNGFADENGRRPATDGAREPRHPDDELARSSTGDTVEEAAEPSWPEGSLPGKQRARAPVRQEQLTLL